MTDDPKGRTVRAGIQSLVPKALNVEMEILSNPDADPKRQDEAFWLVCGKIGYQPPGDHVVLDNATLLDLERRVADWMRQHQRKLLKGEQS